MTYAPAVVTYAPPPGKRWKVPPGQSFSDPNADGVCPHIEQWWVTVDVAPTGTGITFAEKV